MLPMSNPHRANVTRYAQEKGILVPEKAQACDLAASGDGEAAAIVFIGTIQAIAMQARLVGDVKKYAGMRCVFVRSVGAPSRTRNDADMRSANVASIVKRIQ